ncbi:PHP domain-containing protein, partial [Vibrio paucivorans]
MTFGARFHRGDLHIHSYGSGGSYDVIDSQMTPENIIAEAIKENLSIISITDHNKISNSIDAVNIAEDKEDLLVVPGIEISTTQGHLLAYF